MRAKKVYTKQPTNVCQYFPLVPTYRTLYPLLYVILDYNETIQQEGADNLPTNTQLYMILLFNGSVACM